MVRYITPFQFSVGFLVSARNGIFMQCQMFSNFASLDFEECLRSATIMRNGALIAQVRSVSWYSGLAVEANSEAFSTTRFSAQASMSAPIGLRLEQNSQVS